MGRHSSTNHSPSSRRHRTHRSISPPPRDKHEHSGRGSAKPVRTDSGSPDPLPRSQSPSPRTKRLKRAQSEREREPRESERNHGSGRGKGSERDTVERKEKKRAQNDDGGGGGSGRSNKSSRSRHERSPERERNGRSRHRSPSPAHHHGSAANAKPRDEVMNSRGDQQMNDEDESIRKMKAAEEALEEKQKQKPSFELSGKLAAETNRVRGVTLLFNEPPEARKPDIKWRLYVFKAGEVLNEPLYIHRQSCYLFGRERRVADIPTDHPSCSKQHAVIQFRQVEKEQSDGALLKQIRPYIMDLGSTNKTFVNDSPIEPQRYYELREKDTIKFGNSSREYVLLHENSIG
ncbi:FHA domain-containing protein DDL isoform X1 [Abrus precatorius]|uniref:FHA domain-containing protein DDL isoform X1 n=1 Tax=Abrus precatorius TaxID=3816 RepID=A0A8B8KFS0_ABRPR|nr:FHA domain-containing protein DDL isoform X1 [Abrus precatorius]